MAFYDGSNRSEIIYGTSRADLVYGNGGNDDIYGYEGADDLYGGTDNDVIFGGAGADNIWGGSGVNDLYGGSGFDWFLMTERDNRGSDDWIGDFQLGVDQINMRAWGVSDFSQLKSLFKTDNSGDAFMNAYYGGKDHYLTIDGVRANQLISSDFLYTNRGAQNKAGTDRGDVMFGSDDGDRLSGRDGNDKLLGGNDFDTLNGERGRDPLYGGAGADDLTGGAQRDFLYGDGSRDVFNFNALTDSRLGRSRDIIEDFTRTDRINASYSDAVSGCGCEGLYVI